MSQQINLLNPALIKQKEYLTLNNMLLALGVAVLLMLAGYGYAQKQLSALIVQRGQVAEELQVVQEQLKQATLQHAPRGPDKALQDQIAQLEQKAKVHEQILEIIGQDSAGREKAFSGLMRAFARQGVEGLWLTGFNFDNSADTLMISGRALQPELVPQYIARLGTEPAFKGKSFAALSISLPKASEPAAGVAPANPSAAGKAPVQARPAGADYIEFVLQSTDKKTANAAEGAKS